MKNQTTISLLKEKWGIKQQFLLSGNEEFMTISFSKENGSNTAMKIL